MDAFSQGASEGRQNGYNGRLMGIYRPKTSRYWWGHFQYQGRRQFVNLGVTWRGKASDRKLAEEAYHRKKAEFVQAIETGQDVNPHLTLKAVADEYLTLHARPHKRSVKDDETVLRRFLSYFGDSFPAKRVTPHALERYRTDRVKEVSQARVNRELAILKSMFSKAVLWGRVGDNPVKRIQAFREDNKRERFLSPQEKEALLKAASSWMQPILVMALNTGMRQGEILSLNWADVNLDHNVLLVRRSKSGKARHIPINSPLAEVLKRLPKRGAYVFTDESGNILNRHGAIRSSFDRLVNKLGLTNFRFHDLRHTFASELAMKGVDIKTIAELLGHGSVRMSERYMHLSPSHKRVAVEMLAPLKTALEREYSVNAGDEAAVASPQPPTENQYTHRWQSGQMHQTVKPPEPRRDNP